MTLLADDATAKAAADKAAADAAAATPEAKAAAEKAAADKVAADAAAGTPEAKAAAEKVAAEKAAAGAAVSADDQRKFLAANGSKAEELAKLSEADLKAQYDTAKATATVPADGKYAFKTPEGVELDKDATAEVEAFAKANKLTLGEAQKVVDMGAKLVGKQNQAFKASIDKVHSDWIESSKSDKEFGGAEFEKNLATAKLGMEGETPEFVKMLNETGLGNHPEMLRHFFRVGKTRAQDKLVKGKESAGQGTGTLTYAKSNHA